MAFFYLLTLSSVALCSMVLPLEIDYPPDYCENIIDTETFDFVVIGSVLGFKPLRLKYPSDYCDNIKETEEFDFVIVGSGPGGSVVARRLAENPDWKILLLEAGQDPNDKVTVPSSVLAKSMTPSWNFTHIPSPQYCKGMIEGHCNLRLAKCLGGNSQVNFMIYNRGHKSDYDYWEEKGNEGWSFNECLPYFQKSENFIGRRISPHQTKRTVSEKYHSKDGPVSINYFNEDPMSSTVRRSLIKSAKGLGISKVSDFSPITPTGILKTPVFADSTGYRFSSARAFLINPPLNLKICKNAVVHKVGLDGKVANRVIFTHKNERIIKIKVKKEVIISAGAFNSPGILERSGIGNPKYLKKAGVQVLHKLPGVGENLQDHVLGIYNMWSVDAHSEGGLNFFSIGLLDLIIQINSKRNHSSPPNLQLLPSLMPFLGKTTRDINIDQFNIDAEIAKDVFDQVDSPYVLLISPAILKTDSKGSVHIVSKRDDAPPKIDLNMLSSKSDISLMVEGLRLAQKIAESKAMRKHKPKQLIFPSCYRAAGNSSKNFQYYECVAKTGSTVYCHPVGTCKMGPVEDKMSVVNEKLQVHGIENLRVIDASIMPKITRGNTEAPTLMIAEKGADFIKQKWNKHPNIKKNNGWLRYLEDLFIKIKNIPGYLELDTKRLVF